MKTRLLALLYAVGGIALAFGLTFGAYLLAGEQLERPPRAVAVRNELAPRPTPTPDEREDVSGPCDEAEHANDPRCARGGDDDRSGGDDRGRDRGRGGDDDDNSGSDDDNSGPGGGGDDNSDSGSDDSGGDDNSGSGSDDAGGDDNSGSGSDDSGGDD